VIGGMLAATILAILFVPLFFALVTRGRRRGDETSGPVQQVNAPAE
jgi:hypothetical protein